MALLTRQRACNIGRLLRIAIALTASMTIITSPGCFRYDGGALGGRFARYQYGGRFIGTRPSVSPDGRLVILSLPSTGSGDLYQYDITTRTTFRLAASNNYEGDPVYSPKGDRIAFVREENGIGHIWLMNADGSGQRQVTSGAKYDHYPIFVDEYEIIFSRNSHSNLGTSAVLYSLNLATDQLRPIGHGHTHGEFVARISDQELLCCRFNGHTHDVVLL